MLRMTHRVNYTMFAPDSVNIFNGGAPGSGAPRSAVHGPHAVCKIAGMSKRLLDSCCRVHFNMSAHSIHFPKLVSCIAPPNNKAASCTMSVCCSTMGNRGFRYPVTTNAFVSVVCVPSNLHTTVRVVRTGPSGLVRHGSFGVTSVDFSPRVVCGGVGGCVPSFRVRCGMSPLHRTVTRS